jgi:single-strand DNA-binding protein
MASLNRVMLIGNLGKDPEMRYLPSGEAVATFSIATTEQWKDKAGAKQERTDWHRIEFFGRIAEVCGEYLKKGSSVYVEGRVQYDQWDDKVSGEKKFSTKIKGERMTMLGGKAGMGGGSDASMDDGMNQSTPSQPSSRPAAPSRPSKPSKMDDFEDDIPF